MLLLVGLDGGVQSRLRDTQSYFKPFIAEKGKPTPCKPKTKKKKERKEKEGKRVGIVFLAWLSFAFFFAGFCFVLYWLAPRLIVDCATRQCRLLNRESCWVQRPTSRSGKQAMHTASSRRLLKPLATLLKASVSATGLPSHQR